MMQQPLGSFTRYIDAIEEQYDIGGALSELSYVDNCIRVDLRQGKFRFIFYNNCWYRGHFSHYHGF